MKKMILASSSSIYGSSYLEYLRPKLKEFFVGIEELIFIPYARPSGMSYDSYTDYVQKGFDFFGITVRGIHTFKDPKDALENAQAIFTGGGNTFTLVDALYKNDLISVLRNKIASGTLYLGTSAGSNICGISMQTTNDMPIVMPESFTTLGAIPFNINAHYIEPSKDSKHKGETRSTRIKEFHVYNDTPVIGLREGSWLYVNENEMLLEGDFNAAFFEKDKEKIEYPPKTDFLNM